MGASNEEFEAGHSPISYRYVFGHPTQHQMVATARVDTEVSPGVVVPVRKHIGELSWSKKTGVAKIIVDPEHRNKGIGTELWRQATALANVRGYVAPNAAASTTRTDAGDAFLKKIDPNAGERKHKADDSFGDVNL